MRAARLQIALEWLTEAIRDVEKEVAAMKAEHDPLASHIFVSRREYRSAEDTKSGKRRDVAARLSYSRACEFGFSREPRRLGKVDGSGGEAMRRGLEPVRIADGRRPPDVEPPFATLPLGAASRHKPCPGAGGQLDPFERRPIV